MFRDMLAAQGIRIKVVVHEIRNDQGMLVHTEVTVIRES